MFSGECRGARQRRRSLTRQSSGASGERLGGRQLVQGNNDGFGRLCADATVRVRGRRIEIDGITGLKHGFLTSMEHSELAREHIEKLEPGVNMGFGLHLRRQRHEFRKIRVHVPVGDHVAKTLEGVGGRFDASLRHADAILLAVDAKHGSRLRIKEVRQVFRKNHGDARQVSQRGDHASGLKLREKAGGKTGVSPKFHQTH